MIWSFPMTQAITHELTVKFREDGSFQYLGNKILEDGIHQIPQYQYRIARLYPIEQQKEPNRSYF